MRRYLLVLALLFQIGYVSAQKNVVDKIIAIVGDEIILKSDIENAFLQEQGQGMISSSSDFRTELLEQQLIQKLLMAQAKLDSIQVTEDEVEAEVGQRIDYLTANIGSLERLEAYFNKSLDEIKDEMRSPIREKLTTEKMQQKIVEKIRITPSEVKAYYKKLSKDSLPDMPDKYELQQIMLKPNIGDAEKERIRTRLREFREQIISGQKSFNTLAVLYSEDGSAAHGGELGYKTRMEWTPEFSEAAFSLKPGKVSKIVETEFGFHIIQLIDRQGEKVNVRHIILQPKISEEEKQEALHRLDTVKQYISEGKMTFEEAAFYFSTDKQTKNNGGLIANSNSGEAKIAKAEIGGEMAKVVNKMKVGEVSEPFLDRNKLNGQEEYKIIKVKAFYPHHQANLDEDWMNFEVMLKQEKQMDKLEKWIKEKQAATYIHIDESYKKSKFRYDQWFK